jgi:integrase/recombinase XerC
VTTRGPVKPDTLARRPSSSPAGGSVASGEANRETIERLMTSFWAGRSPHTLVAYQGDLQRFSEYVIRAHALDPDTPQLEVLRVFFGSSAGRANELVLNYRAEMRDRDRAPTTINRRLAAVRSLVKLARLTGAVYWSIEVEGVPHELTRDTRGPDVDTVGRLITSASQHANPDIAARDVAMLRTLFDLGLRIGELVRLDLADLEQATGGLWVLGKGRARKVLLTLPAPTAGAIRAWLDRRGKQAGPLFLSYSGNRHRDSRLVTRGAYRIVRNIGRRFGIHLHPHQLRHSAITSAVDQSVAMGLSLDQVRDFSGHKSINVLLTYRDKAANQQSTIANAVAKSTDPKLKGVDSRAINGGSTDGPTQKPTSRHRAIGNRAIHSERSGERSRCAAVGSRVRTDPERRYGRPSPTIGPSIWFSVKEVAEALAFDSDDSCIEWLERSNIVIVTNDAGQFVHRRDLEDAVVRAKPKDPTPPTLRVTSPRFAVFAKEVDMHVRREELFRRRA